MLKIYVHYVGPRAVLTSLSVSAGQLPPTAFSPSSIPGPYEDTDWDRPYCTDNPSEYINCWSQRAAYNDRLVADRSQRALTGKHHGRSPGAEPGIVVRSFGTDNTADRHEETTCVSIDPKSRLQRTRDGRLVCRKRPKRLHIPKGSSRSNHVFTQSSHNSVRSSAILENGDGS